MKKLDWILIVGIGAGKGNTEYVSLDLTKNTLNRQNKYFQNFGKNLGDYPSSNFTNFCKCMNSRIVTSLQDKSKFNVSKSCNNNVKFIQSL